VLAVAGIALAGCGGQGTGPQPSGAGSGAAPGLIDDGPPQFTWGKPAGAYAGAAPRGVVFLVHGGGWRPNPIAYRQQLSLAPAYQRAGFATLVLGYGPGPNGLEDLEHFYDRARRRYGKRTPVCVIGASAGGHLALMLATREPGLACVIDLGGPADLTTLPDQGAADTYQLAVSAFGADELDGWSPIRDARRIKAKVMLIFAAADQVVPEQQGEEMAKALPGSTLIILPPGDAPFVHGRDVDLAAKQAAAQQQVQFLNAATAGR
jgi:dienelactone hydrolase